MTTDEDRFGILASPFYLKMMGTNALSIDDALLKRVVRAGRTATPDDVVALLMDPWRATVMGAWLSVFQNDGRVTSAVLDALRGSLGSLTAPPLSVAAVLLGGPSSIPPLNEYLSNDVENGWGSAAFVSAALAHLGEIVVSPQPTDADRDRFSAMLSLAERFQAEGAR